MRSPRCSRTVSRKSLRNPVLLIPFILVVPVAVPAQIEHETQVIALRDYFEVSISVNGADPDLLFGNLAEGLTARLEYAVRVSHPRNPPLSLFGSRLLSEYRVIYHARWDPFRDRYTISTQDGGLFTFRDEAALWRFFFTLPHYRIPWQGIGAGDPATPSRYQVDTQVVYEPVVFVPGLSILSVFLPHARQSSLWERSYLEEPR